MPSKKILEAKQQMVDELAEKMKSAVSGVLVDYKGITVEDDTKLRAELRKEGVFYAVKKNSIIGLAAKKAGLENFDEYLKGSTAIAISDADLIAPAKILAKFAEGKDNFNLKAGFIEGETVGAEKVQELAKLPSKEVLVAKFLGSMNAPISGFVNVLNGNLRGLVVALNAIAEKKSA
ncbi:MAG TPA: 50S ribosomal protein L10 [Ruminiclostridium sp.]|nr:50S ribosomal protein L10 [Ruminiclostridium sp.]